MPDLSFQIEGAEAVPFTASPLLAFKLRVTCADVETTIQTVALRCQIQIEATHRRYNAGEQERLLDLFGEPERWSRTLRAMLWTHTSVIVTPFQGSTLVDLQVPCTFDFNVAATKYFAGLEDGEVPLNLMFSGTVFYEADDRNLQVEQISMGQRGEVSSAGARLERDDEHLLPEHRLALSAPRRVRPFVSVQDAPWDSDVGADARQSPPGRRGDRGRGNRD